MTRAATTEANLQRTVDELRRELGARTAELAEARAQQSATADVLKVISRSAFDLQTVLETLIRSAVELSGAVRGTIYLRDGDLFRFRAASYEDINPTWLAFLKDNPQRAGRHSTAARAIASGQTVCIPDLLADPEIEIPANALAGTRAVLATPLLRDAKVEGVMVLSRPTAGPFTQRQIELVETFADQAVIAIENARLFDEVQQRTRDLSESLQQQTATADVLKVISRSAFDLQTVLNTLTESAAQLCNADMGSIARKDETGYYHATNYNFAVDWVRLTDTTRLQPGRGSLIGRVLLAEKAVQIIDVLDDAEYGYRDMQQAAGYRTLLGVPLVRQGEAIGVLFLGRKTVEQFTDKQIELLSTFADQAVIAIENARLFDEVQARTRDVEEALRYQTGSATILNVIASSPTDVQPVLNAIVESACELCGAYDANVLLRYGDELHFSAHHGPIPTGTSARPISREWVTGRSVVDKVPVQVSDFDGPEAADFPEGRRQSREQGHRCTLSVPLLREDEAIGAIALRRLEPVAFNEKQISLLQTFADQAVIALGNVRLFEEVRAKTHDLEEALRYQTGSANILNVIASSPTNVAPVLKAIVESACELCDANDAVVHLLERNDVCYAAHHGPVAIGLQRRRVNRDFVAGRAIIDKVTIHLHDVLSNEGAEFPEAQLLSSKVGIRTILAVPMVAEGKCFGDIMLRRTEVRPFSDKQITLLQTFADQAVIAIGNVRLFEEVQARTRDLQESLQQQTATADVLKVISRSAFDLQVVLDTLVQSAARLCEADLALITRQKGDQFFRAGSYGFSAEFMEHMKDVPVTPERGSIGGRTLLEGKVIHVPDVHADPDYNFWEAQRLSGDPRSILGVPLLREGKPVGALVLLRRKVRPFNDKQIELVTTFADQAVIAIENVRLFDEVQTKTRDLTEALVYQTGSSNILKIIASSPTDVGPALQAIVESACEICDAYDAVGFLKDGDDLVFAAHYGPIPIDMGRWPINRKWVTGRAAVDKVPQHVHDLRAEGAEFPEGQQLSREQGQRTVLSVPLLLEGEALGVISLRRVDVQPFNEKQIELLKSFADQAVIAISNVRLFEQVQARTRDLEESLQQQTATADVLKVISRSTFDLQTVLDTLLTSAARLCHADHSFIFLREGDAYRFAAGSGGVPEWIEYLKQQSIRPGRGTVAARAVLEARTIHIPDVLADPEYTFLEAQKRGGFRTALGVPLLREGTSIGVMVLTRLVVRPFDDTHIALVTTFADQAVIAIENIRLFENVQTRTRELTKSLDNLRAAQDRLIQTEKLASLGQLTAGIAHEIKNPLNFVNNFAALSVELTDELNEELKQASMADKIRAEVDELTGLLKDNLSKVVQHGKRADSIVKNMLLHSREGSGEHRPTDVNALVDESLNLAYHGARAEKPQFNVTLRRDFDPEAGMIEAFPQEITRVFLNLLSNGFYAVTKRKAEIGEAFEPMVSTTTKGRTDHVEIRIRDNGTGIPNEVKERIFNPFFTTKPAGEGTGLGLSMSHDIIVKQHGGAIEVDTTPGEFTEFRIVLPRTNNFSNKSRG